MARQVAIPYTFTTDVATYDSTNSTFYQQAPGYPPENGLGDGTGAYAGFHLTRGSGAVTTVWYGFNCDDIPNDATITSVSLSERASMSTSTTTNVSQATLQLYSGTTAKGSSTSILKTTAQYFTVNGGNSWTVAEIKNCRLRAYAKRGSRNTSSQYTMRLFGGTLTVNYTLNGMIYTITATTDSEEIIAPSTQEVYEGRNCSVSVTTDSLNNHIITDNNTNVTNQFIYVPPDTGGTMTRYPDGYITDGTISGLNYRSTIGCGVDNPSSSTNFDYTPNASTTATIYYTFDFSDLPDSATISSMSIQVRYMVNNTSYAQTVRPYKGTSGVGTAVTLTSTSQTTTSITSYGTWTAAELKSDPRIGLSLSFSGAIITGITWSVTYTADEPARYKYILSNVQADHNIVLVVTQDTVGTFYIKQNGTWNEVSKIYLKQNGSWVEQDLSYLDNNNIKYLKQGS